MNAGFGVVGLAVQASIFVAVYLASSPARGRAMAAVLAAIMAVNGYALVVLGLMTLNVTWQVTNSVLGFLLIIAVVFRRRLPLGPRRTGAGLLSLVRREWGTGLILGGVVSFQLAVALLTPELSIDGRLYHGPILAQIAQNGALWGWEAPNQYLYYSDLAMVSGINLATFTGGTVLDNGAQIPHLLLMMLALIAVLGVRYRRGWQRAAFALAIVAAPVIWIQARILYVDIAYGAAVLALIVLIVLGCRSPGEVVVAAVTAASVFAIKPAGIQPAAVLIVVLFIVALVRMRRGGRSWPRAVGVTALAGVVPIVLATGFYLRNLALWGNPVYPVTTTVGPLVLPGPVDPTVFGSAGFAAPSRWVGYVESIGSGTLRGVTKLDYDPRSGGYGVIPAIVVGIALAAVLAQLLVARGSRRLDWRGALRVQLPLIALAAAVLLVQTSPAADDSRYVMGPTVALLAAAVLVTVVRRSPGIVDAAAGAMAVLLALGQIAWTEMRVYPGLAAIRELRNLPDEFQPDTPGNPWGRADEVAWLPTDEGCLVIAVQSEGGVGSSGMMERSLLSTLPYGLYGEELCNIVIPVELEEDGSVRPSDAFDEADFAVLYDVDVASWRALEPGSECWQPVADLAGTADFPEPVTVLDTRCL